MKPLGRPTVWFLSVREYCTCPQCKLSTHRGKIRKLYARQGRAIAKRGSLKLISEGILEYTEVV